MATYTTQLGGGVKAQQPETVGKERPHIGPEATKLGELILDQIERGDPVWKYPAEMVERVAVEREGPLCILGTNVREDAPFQVIDSNTFLGVTCDTNPSESRRNTDEWANAHVHWKASETYVPVKGRMWLIVWRGRKRFTYEASVADILHVPPGVPHKVEINPADGRTVVYVFRSPTAVADYKQPLPPKNRS